MSSLYISHLVNKQQMVAERMTPIRKAMVTSSQEIPLETGSIITGNKDEIWKNLFIFKDGK